MHRVVDSIQRWLVRQEWRQQDACPTDLRGFGGEDAFVFLHGVAVGHAGEVIADRRVEAEFPDALTGVLADFCGCLT